MIVYRRGFISVQGHIIVLIGLTHQREELKGSDENFPPDTQVAERMCCPFLGPFVTFLSFPVLKHDNSSIWVVWDFCSVLHAVKGFFQALLLGSLWSCDVEHTAVFPRHYSHHFLLHSFHLCPVYVGGGYIEDVRGNLVEWQSRGMSGKHTAEKRPPQLLKEKRIGCAGLCIFFPNITTKVKLFPMKPLEKKYCHLSLNFAIMFLELCLKFMKIHGLFSKQ